MEVQELRRTHGILYETLLSNRRTSRRETLGSADGESGVEEGVCDDEWVGWLDEGVAADLEE